MAIKEYCACRKIIIIYGEKGQIRLEIITIELCTHFVVPSFFGEVLHYSIFLTLEGAMLLCDRQNYALASTDEFDDYLGCQTQDCSSSLGVKNCLHSLKNGDIAGALKKRRKIFEIIGVKNALRLLNRFEKIFSTALFMQNV